MLGAISRESFDYGFQKEILDEFLTGFLPRAPYTDCGFTQESTKGYAKARLLDPQGQNNDDGRKIAVRLSAKWPTRLWLFYDSDDGEPTHCPMCKNI